MARPAHSAVFLPALAAVLLFLPAPAPGARAQGGTTDPIRVLVERVLRDNPALKAQRAKVEAARQVAPQARALPDPTADVEFMGLSTDSPRLSEGLTRSVSVGVTQSLPYPGKRALAGEKAQLAAAAEGRRLQAMESDLRGRAVGAAYRLALAQRLLDLNLEKQKALEAAAESAAALYASGSGTQADLILAQTALTRELAEREELEREYSVALQELQRLAGGPVDGAGLSSLPLPRPEPLPPLEVVAGGLAGNAPALLAAQAEEKVLETQVEIARKNFKPDFLAGVRYRRRDMAMGGGDYVTLSFGVSLPLFHRGDRYRPALEEALFARESARFTVEDALTAARYDLAEAYAQARRDLRVEGLASEGLLIQARQAYESALAAYGAGKADFTTLLKALLDLYDFEAESWTARAGFWIATARMEAILGRPIQTQPPAASPAKQAPIPSEKESTP